ncbi:site-specific DNA-methyltransferase [Nitrosomonas sp. HPC101]|uniref:site-specific DNA-methyltransferase n=1 Tax=Nitrosomonas sp. HPC101 TaxID=1658667 RepID=UPI001371AE6E|nr:site-specific DNA-methyltransferase [Nitrosomonas sp. HPC101]MXS84429.1 site-specific DNA-methyltransferase [Nitrosomonas sp. HPC101]
MDKLKMHSPNLTEDNIARIREMFPGCVTEARGEDGSVRLAVDFDQLRQELSSVIVEGPQERYHLNWPGKREALLTANAPIAKTLRPCREESVDFDTTKNLFIEGDNLDALKLLQETYLGKVKMIYIDPPYNTGNDFIYEDDFAEDAGEYLRRSNQVDEDGNRLAANTAANGRFHSDWLTMMYSRLRLARNLLRDDGLIFITIDDGEVASLRHCCDEIFGATNFVAQIAWEKRYTRSNNAKRFYSLKDNILVFRCSESLDIIKEKRSEKADSGYRNPDNDPRGAWITSSYVNPATKEARPNLVYGIKNPITGAIVHHPTHAWKYSQTEHKQHVAENRLYWAKDGDAEYPRLKIYLSDQTGGMVPVDVWDYKSSGTTDDGGAEIKELFGAAVFDTPKPTRLIQRILGIGTTGQGNEIIVDFFAGSCSTAAAVLQQNKEDGGNRRCISVQIAESPATGSVAEKQGFTSIAEVSKERIRRIGKKVLEDTSHENWDKDIGFRVLKIDTSNMADVYYSPDSLDKANLDLFVDNIKPDRTAEDLLFQVMLDWGVDLALPIEKKPIQGKDVFFVDGDALAACFDAHGGIDEAFVKELAKQQPLRVVFRDAGFKDSAVKINVEQIFKLLSPGTEVKSI